MMMQRIATLFLPLVCTSLILAQISLDQGASLDEGAGPDQGASHEARLAALQLKLPPVSEPVGIYRRAVVVDNLIYLAGHIPIDADGRIMTGRVGAGVNVETARQAARRSGLAMLATLRAELGSLDRVKRLVKTTGMVNSSTDFHDQPAVVNGCSELFRDVFGAERGVGARSAVGMAALPKGAIVEIEAVFEIKP